MLIYRKFYIGIKLFSRRINNLITQPVFIVLTIVGNSSIFIGALLLYKVEHGLNPKIQNMLDTIWWSVATVTTVGYGDISPITTWGKIIGICMMIGGTALFWSYTALFAGALVSEEISEVEQELKMLDKSLKNLGRNIDLDEQSRNRIISEMEKSLNQLRIVSQNKDKQRK